MIQEANYTQARQNLAALLDQVTDTRAPVLIRRRGKEAAALIAADELAGWKPPTFCDPRTMPAAFLKQATERRRDWVRPFIPMICASVLGC